MANEEKAAKDMLMDMFNMSSEEMLEAAQADLARLFNERELSEYPALVGMMMKTVAQFMFVNVGGIETPVDNDVGYTAIISLENDSVEENTDLFAKINFEYVSRDSLFNVGNDTVH